MRILIDARLYGLENAGLGRYVINLVEELKKIDTKNEYIILLRKKYYKTFTLPDNWKKVLLDIRHYSVLEQLVLPIVLYLYKPDLVHFPHFNVPFFYFGKYVVTIHDLLMHKFVGGETTTRSNFFYQIKRLGYKIIFSKAIYSSKTIIVPSKTVKNEILDVYSIDANMVIVTYEGMDNNITQYGKNGYNILNKYKLTRDYVIYIGNAYPHKNLPIAVKAVKEYNDHYPEKLDFVIATSRDIFMERLSNIIKDNSASGYVKLLGYVPDCDLGVLYKNSVGFLYPSLSEGFGLQGLEVMSSGSLLMASDIPVFREIYSENVLYFNPKDVNSVIEAIRKAVSLTPTARKQIIQKAIDFIKKYSWRKMAEETSQVYEDSVK